MVSFMAIIVTFEALVLGLYRVSWTNEWFSPDALVLEILDKTYAQVFCSFSTCKISYVLNFANFSMAKATYYCSNVSLGWLLV